VLLNLWRAGAIPVEMFRSERFRSVLCIYLESSSARKDGTNRMKQAQDELTDNLASDGSPINVSYAMLKFMRLPIYHGNFRATSRTEMVAILKLVQVYFGTDQSCEKSRAVFALCAEVSGRVRSSVMQTEEETDGPLRHKLVITEPIVELEPEAVETNLLEVTLSALAKVSTVSHNSVAKINTII
jgi:hypothetical protein